MRRALTPWVGLLLLASLGGGPVERVRADTTVFAGIEPVAQLVRELAGPDVLVQTLLPAGAAPATFEPGARHVVRLAGAEHLFVVGLPFERSFVRRMQGNDSLPAWTDLSQGLRSGEDPHVWLDPVALGAMAETVTETLVALRPTDASAVRQRLDEVRDRLDALHEELLRELAGADGRILLTVHPAYGAFARRYSLRQIALEQDGHPPTAQHLAQLVERLREAANVRIVLTQPQHSDRAARLLQRELDLRLVEVDPLAGDVTAVLRRLASLFSEPEPGS